MAHVHLHVHKKSEIETSISCTLCEGRNQRRRAAMSDFHQRLLDQAQGTWNAILNHRFLKMTAEGSIPDTTFKTWIQQDYVFVREAIPFVAILLAKAPMHLRSNLIQVLSGLDQELELFRKNAAVHGVNLENVTPSPTCYAYNQFLISTAYNCSFPESLAVLYAAEKTYLDSWMEVKNNLKVQSPWQEFIENWTNEEFQGFVDWLAGTLNDLARDKPERECQRMEELFLITARYEYLFWEMAATEETWPV
jgi:thiaminase